MADIEAELRYAAELRDWMREPDFVENASLEWMADWINRRPLAALTALEREPLEQAAKAIESIRLHEVASATPTHAHTAEWLRGQDDGFMNGLKYAARTVRALIADEQGAKL